MYIVYNGYLKSTKWIEWFVGSLYQEVPCVEGAVQTVTLVAGRPWQVSATNDSNFCIFTATKVPAYSYVSKFPAKVNTYLKAIFLYKYLIIR
jgi:hypothetical protein